jgi:hypothetical protein
MSAPLRATFGGFSAIFISLLPTAPVFRLLVGCF